MDPVTIIVAALAAGATAGLTGVAETAIKDAYAGVKQWLQDHYAGVDLRNLEKDPRSQNRQGVLAEELAEGGAAEDAELLRQVQALTEALAKSEEGRRAAQVVGVKLENLVIDQDLNISDIDSTGTGVHLKDSDVGGSVEIKGVKAGRDKGGASPNP